MHYDSDADVLYLHVGEPASAVDFDESPEGHHLRFDGDGQVIGITMVGVARGLEAGRVLTVTLPERVELDLVDLRGVLGSAA